MPKELHLRHGTIDGYENHNCRCDRCRAAARNYRRSLCTKPCRECGAPVYVHGRRNRAAWDARGHRCGRCFLADNIPPINHGTESAYTNVRCRCNACVEAARVAKARRRAARPELYAEIDRRSKRRQRA